MLRYLLLHCLLTVSFLLALCLPAGAEKLVVAGDMGSAIRFDYTQSISFPEQATRLQTSFVKPVSFVSPTFSQQISGYSLELTPEPNSRKTTRDARGNTVITAIWNSPPKAVQAHVTFNARNTTTLRALNTDAPFPVVDIPKEAKPFTRPSPMVQSDDPTVKRLSAQLVSGAHTEYQAVTKIMDKVVDSMRYVSVPSKYDALSAIETGQGNCQNYAHYSAALMRAAGIPVRIVNGFTLDKPYSVGTETGSIFTFKAVKGRHAWIEVWFPKLGWVPFDPQKTTMFVANRFIRAEIGMDNSETKSDGKITWTRPAGQSSRPSVRSATTGEFLADVVTVTGARAAQGPRQLVLGPEVLTNQQQEPAVEPAPQPKPEPAKPEPAQPKQTPKPEPTPEPVPNPEPKPEPSPKPEPAPEQPQPTPAGAIMLGNLDFPENHDFTEYGTESKISDTEFEITRNFLVESAEYVTTRATQYAQIFQVTEPVELADISLALHRFGGGGSVWADLYTDADGKPGEIIAASDLCDAAELSLEPGYRWTTFDFSMEKILLKPGWYWIGLGFTGDPIINWFYTPGKPVGPSYGTRYKGVFDESWSAALDYEFNYKVTGTTAEN